MGTRIRGQPLSDVPAFNFLIKVLDYFVHIGIDPEKASELHYSYYVQYGLALRGLTRHHDVGSEIQNAPLIPRS
jgi:hypothetical protein